MTAISNRIRLVPIDYKSEDHIQRLVDQRKACGWSHELVPLWMKMQEEGTKTMFFIALGNYFTKEQKETMLQQHWAKDPKENIPLTDSATTLETSPRTPTLITFYPIGHIAYQPNTAESIKLGLMPPENFKWITSLYISHGIQGGGLGRAAMDVTETMLVSMGAKTMVIDTTAKESTDEERWKQWRYESRGHKRPAVLVSNQEWYERQGYRRIGHEEMGYESYDEKTGELWWAVKCFLRKDVA